MPRISVKPGTAGYWRRCRDEIWLLHGEGGSPENIASRMGVSLASVRRALRELDDEVRARRLAVEVAEKEARRAGIEAAASEAGEIARARAEAAIAAGRAIAERRKLEKLSRPKPAIEDRIMAHWGKGEDTFEIARIVKRGEPFVVGVLVARREAARRATRGAA